MALAYNYGWLTQDDLKSIAYYQNGGRELNEDIMPEDYEPMQKSPEVLSEDTARRIRETVAFGYRNDEKSPIPNASEANVTISQYYGCYGGIYVLMESDAYTEYPDAGHTLTVGGVNFGFADGNGISLYIDSPDPRTVMIDAMENVRIDGSTAQEYDGEVEPWQEIIRTRDELNALLEQHPSAEADRFARYDEEYFAENALVVCSLSLSTGDGELTYVGAVRAWNRLIVKITYEEGVEDTTSGRLVTLELKKSDVEDVIALIIEVEQV